ncbi:hypothetical protein F4825DRAFT_93147 [Nemania diffusa]|nr:hypothetical protein F4825DRAFT_93147 [Nemania diffusa]
MPGFLVSLLQQAVLVTSYLGSHDWHSYLFVDVCVQSGRDVVSRVVKSQLISLPCSMLAGCAVKPAYKQGAEECTTQHS